MRRAADRAGQQPRAVLHQRRLPRADRAAAHPLGVAGRGDIEAVGPVWIERLAAAGDLEHPSDFYALTREQLLEFDRIGEVRADRMVESIEPRRTSGCGAR